MEDDCDGRDHPKGQQDHRAENDEEGYASALTAGAGRTGKSNARQQERSETHKGGIPPNGPCWNTGPVQANGAFAIG